MSRTLSRKLELYFLHVTVSKLLFGDEKALGRGWKGREMAMSTMDKMTRNGPEDRDAPRYVFLFWNRASTINPRYTTFIKLATDTVALLEMNYRFATMPNPHRTSQPF